MNTPLLLQMFVLPATCSASVHFSHFYPANTCCSSSCCCCCRSRCFLPIEIKLHLIIRLGRRNACPFWLCVPVISSSSFWPWWSSPRPDRRQLAPTCCEWRRCKGRTLRPTCTWRGFIVIRSVCRRLLGRRRRPRRRRRRRRDETIRPAGYLGVCVTCCSSQTQLDQTGHLSSSVDSQTSLSRPPPSWWLASFQCIESVGE